MCLRLMWSNVNGLKMITLTEFEYLIALTDMTAISSIKYSQYQSDHIKRIWLFYRIEEYAIKYRWTSLYARDRDSKNMLAYNKFAYTVN